MRPPSGLGWGVVGCALATTLASAVSCSVLIGLLLKKGMLKLPDLFVPPSWEAIAPVLRAGLPLAFRNIISFGELGGGGKGGSWGEEGREGSCLAEGERFLAEGFWLWIGYLWEGDARAAGWLSSPKPGWPRSHAPLSSEPCRHGAVRFIPLCQGGLGVSGIL
jgi:hypothetical protein